MQEGVGFTYCLEDKPLQPGEVSLLKLLRGDGFHNLLEEIAHAFSVTLK